MTICDAELDSKQLMSKDELIAFLHENGESDRALAHVRERYYEVFGKEMMWCYPISDGKHAGTFIVCVKEGFISLPYDMIDAEDYELLELGDAAMLDDETIEYFIDDWKLFSDDLMKAMTDMLCILRVDGQ